MAVSERDLFSLLENLSLSRKRDFLYKIEDECLNLLAAHRTSGGRITHLTLPPLSQNLRELVSVTAQRFLLRDAVLPEGDVEKPMKLSVRQGPTKSRAPCLLYSDFIPAKCPLLSHAQHGPSAAKPARREGTEVGAAGPREHTGGGSDVSSAVPMKSEKGGESASRGARGRPSMGIYRPRRAVEAREEAAREEQERQKRLERLRAGQGAGREQSDAGPEHTSAPRARDHRADIHDNKSVVLAVGKNDAMASGGDAMDTDTMEATGVVGTDPSAQRMDPTAQRMDPTAQRMDPTAQRMDPTAQRMDPTAQRMDPTVQRMDTTAQRAHEEGDAEMGSDEDEDDACSLVHDYGSFRLDLTPKAWGEHEKRTPYVEFEAGSKGQGWRWDKAWMLRGDNNGTVAFCIQQGVSSPSSKGGSAVCVGLAGECDNECTCVVTIDAEAESAVIVRKEGGRVIARAQGSAHTRTTAPPESAPSSGRPPPKKLWLVVRHGLVAVGCGAYVGVAGTLAALSGGTPSVAWRRFGFSLERTADAPVTLYRIGTGGKIAKQTATSSHMHLIGAPGAFAPCVQAHDDLTARLRTVHVPPRGLTHWRGLPSCVTWAPPQVPHNSAMNDTLVGRLRALGARVVASSPDWGWVLLPWVGVEQEAREIVGSFGGVWCGGLCEADREQLSVSGITLSRERSTVVNPATAHRLISSALRQSPAKRARGGRSGASAWL